MGVEPKIGGCKTPKMDGLFHGKPYEQMDDLGVCPPIFGNTHIFFRCPPFQQNQLIHRDSGGSTVFFFFGIRYQQNHCRMGNGELIFFPKILGTCRLYPQFLRKSVFFGHPKCTNYQF